GIDVTGIELVVNYDLPDDTEHYVHRIGRTGRAGHEGRAISFATPEQGKDVRSIEKLIKTALPIVEHPEFPKEKFVEEPKSYQGSKPYQGRRSRNNSSPGNKHRKRSYRK
ncbi:MAG: ATP-dependent helicase, partial [Candidatus Omnitrophica bacterium]|nr:ATP-dependent helicase [Candidatus Omnitrophota bacterium]